jgi:hypothetical protein
MRYYNQLSIEDRSLIQTQLAIGFKPTWIAKVLGRSVSTITRELHRNCWTSGDIKCGQRELIADLMARFCASQRKVCSLIGLSRSSWHYQSIALESSALQMRIKEITDTRRHYGDGRVHVMLKRESWKTITNGYIVCIKKWIYH